MLYLIRNEFVQPSEATGQELVIASKDDTQEKQERYAQALRNGCN